MWAFIKNNRCFAVLYPSTASLRSAPLRGIKPQKYSDSVGSPLITHAVKTAFAPGSTSNGRLFSTKT